MQFEVIQVIRMNGKTMKIKKWMLHFWNLLATLILFYVRIPEEHHPKGFRDVYIWISELFGTASFCNFYFYIISYFLKWSRLQFILFFIFNSLKSRPKYALIYIYIYIYIYIEKQRFIKQDYIKVWWCI